MTGGLSEPLYQRLGGYDAMASTVRDLYDRAFADHATAVFFCGRTRQNRQHIVQHTVDFFHALAGASTINTGADMTSAHLVAVLDSRGEAETKMNFSF